MESTLSNGIRVTTADTLYGIVLRAEIPNSVLNSVAQDNIVRLSVPAKILAHTYFKERSTKNINKFYCVALIDSFTFNNDDVTVTLLIDRPRSCTTFENSVICEVIVPDAVLIHNSLFRLTAYLSIASRGDKK